jgi:hypothetical protein
MIFLLNVSQHSIFSYGKCMLIGRDKNCLINSFSKIIRLVFLLPTFHDKISFPSRPEFDYPPLSIKDVQRKLKMSPSCDEARALLRGKWGPQREPLSISLGKGDGSGCTGNVRLVRPAYEDLDITVDVDSFEIKTDGLQSVVENSGMVKLVLYTNQHSACWQDQDSHLTMKLGALPPSAFRTREEAIKGPASNISLRTIPRIKVADVGCASVFLYLPAFRSITEHSGVFVQVPPVDILKQYIDEVLKPAIRLAASQYPNVKSHVPPSFEFLNFFGRRKTGTYKNVTMTINGSIFEILLEEMENIVDQGGSRLRYFEDCFLMYSAKGVKYSAILMEDLSCEFKCFCGPHCMSPAATALKNCFVDFEKLKRAADVYVDIGVSLGHRHEGVSLLWDADVVQRCVAASGGSTAASRMDPYLHTQESSGMRSATLPSFASSFGSAYTYQQFYQLEKNHSYQHRADNHGPTSLTPEDVLFGTTLFDSIECIFTGADDAFHLQGQGDGARYEVRVLLDFAPSVTTLQHTVERFFDKSDSSISPLIAVRAENLQRLRRAKVNAALKVMETLKANIGQELVGDKNELDKIGLLCACVYYIISTMKRPPEDELSGFLRKAFFEPASMSRFNTLLFLPFNLNSEGELKLRESDDDDLERVRNHARIQKIFNRLYREQLETRKKMERYAARKRKQEEVAEGKRKKSEQQARQKEEKEKAAEKQRLEQEAKQAARMAKKHAPPVPDSPDHPLELNSRILLHNILYDQCGGKFKPEHFGMFDCSSMHSKGFTH